ncbi:MAG: maleylacetoacetate isomerase [Candidatus Binatia bacterium]
MTLYTYYRSSAAYRVRIALELKGLSAERVEIDLRRGDQRAAAYLARNPQGLVPALAAGPEVLIQSLAIIEYLDELVPDPPLLPATPLGRARVRGLAQVIASDIHPLNNLRVLRYLESALGVGENERLRWYRHWIAEGLSAIEQLLATRAETGTFCHGDAPTLADICLVPQVHNARRYACPLDAYPVTCAIDEACRALPAFQRAHPDAQAAMK